MIRLPTHLEVAAIRRRAEVLGGIATIVAKGYPDSGTLLLLTMKNGQDPRLWERLPDVKGGRRWVCSNQQDTDKNTEIESILRKRLSQDPDAWLIELDIPEPERFIAETAC